MKQLSNRTIKIFSIILFLIISFALCTLHFALPIRAVSPTPAPSGDLSSDVMSAFKTVTKFGNPFKYKDLGTLVSNGLSLGLTVASLLVLLYLLWGGIEWITSAGDKGKLESARNRITNAILGITIVAITFAIYLIIRTFLGLPIGITGLTGGGSGGGGGGGGGTSGAWSCNAYPCDCCNILGDQKQIKCCQQVGNLSSCVIARYKNNTTECSKELKINWNCWTENYDNLVKSNRLNPATDACR